ncbi:VSP [Giardia lamblia P15]|uniref:VSP n=1 Tax=Giardia intestinalis (strain P15) TaxID=658858 RepID=E1F1K4_GIAIA|nr:VSP [Giardia lamblia P15]
MLFVAFCFVLSTLAATCSVDSQVGNCKKGMCEMVGNTEICAECEAGNVPINGVCTAHNDGKVSSAGCKKKANDSVDASSVKCEQCDVANYFLYKGGCYSKDVAPGNEMCKTVTTNGICAEAADKKNFFAVPGATKTDQSVVWCGDVEGVTLGDGKKYTGVADCATCEKPGQLPASGTKAATCSACKGSKLVKTVGDVTSCVEESDCNSGFFVNTNSGRKCTACADENCDVCGAPEAKKCSKCKTNGEKVYLKKENADPTGVCVNAGDCTAGNTHFADDTIDPANGKTCKLCKDGGLTNCAKCEKQESGLVCKDCTAKFSLGKKSCVDECPPNSKAGLDNICACAEGFEPSSDWSACQPKSSCRTPGCKTCAGEGTDKEVCTACLEGKYLTPTSQCVPDCTVIEGYYNDRTANRCEKCNSNCKTCLATDRDKCTSCPAGRALTYEGDPAHGGTCGDACKVSADGAGCEACGAQIGGTAYCSKCKNTQQAPLNGNCAANARVAFCATVTGGACTKCNEGYFLKDGGCYQTDRQPGKQVCSSAQGGACNQCANGLQAQGGACGECHSTCATCSTADAADKCKKCATGYYKTSDSEGSCKKCSEGLAGCRQCTASANAFVCFEMGDNTSENVNKSGLSTGAIAGIAVAVVVVVGGLVGFLCWWFLCRGKA